MIEFGIRWEFYPNREFPDLNAWKNSGFSFLSLRLETFIKYGGPVAQFSEKSESLFKLQFYSDYLPVAALRSWESVHQIASKDFLAKHNASLLTCQNLLPEVPQPSQVIRDLMDGLPKGTRVCLKISSDADLKRIEDLNGIFISVELADLPLASSVLHSANQVSEVVVDFRGKDPDELQITSLKKLRQAQANDQALSICFSFGGDESKLLAKAAEFRARLAQELK